MEYFNYKGYKIIYYPKRKIYMIYPFVQEYKTFKSAKAWIEYLNK
jgi:hypothetical protein